jgi:hypothetical protein
MRRTSVLSTCSSCRPLASLWIDHHPPEATPPAVNQRHRQSDGGLDRPPDNRSLPLGSGTPIPHSGQRRLEWPCRNATSCGHGHSGPTNCAAIALAEWTRRTTHRLDPARVPGPCRGPGRSASAPNPDRVRQLLQRTPNPPISDQRHPSSSSSRASRRCQITTDPRRPSPPVLQNLIFGTHNRRLSDSTRRRLAVDGMTCFNNRPSRAAT